MSEQLHHGPRHAPQGAEEDRDGLEFDGQAGAALHHQRRSLGLTATQVARRVGITQRRMARLELGLEPLTLRLAVSLGAVLGMPAGWFLGLKAAALPEAVGISLDHAHDDWARRLDANLALAMAGKVAH